MAGLRRIDDGGPVAVLELDRPPVNALAQVTYAELVDCLADAQADADVRALILTAAGTRAFCAGADLNSLGELTPATAPAALAERSRAFTALHEFPLPVVAAVNGPALGAGAMLAALCDVVIASETASFGLPEIDAGVVGGARFLARIFPLAWTRRMALTGERLTAADAFRLGAVTQVVPAGQLREAALAVAGVLAAKAPHAMRMTKQTLLAAEDATLEDGHRAEQDGLLQLIAVPAGGRR